MCLLIRVLSLSLSRTFILFYRDDTLGSSSPNKHITSRPIAPHQLIIMGTWTKRGGTGKRALRKSKTEALQTNTTPGPAHFAKLRRTSDPGAEAEQEAGGEAEGTSRKDRRALRKSKTEAWPNIGTEKDDDEEDRLLFHSSAPGLGAGAGATTSPAAAARKNASSAPVKPCPRSRPA